MNISIKLETVLKFLAAVLPLGLWLVNLNSEVSELSKTVARLESTHSPKIADLARKSHQIDSSLRSLEEASQRFTQNLRTVSAQTSANTNTITEMRVSLKYIEDGINIIKTRVLGPSTSE
jgi:septal ring factor EnvC (AmiA/AmiB activator)